MLARLGSSRVERVVKRHPVLELDNCSPHGLVFVGIAHRNDVEKIRERSGDVELLALHEEEQLHICERCDDDLRASRTTGSILLELVSVRGYGEEMIHLNKHRHWAVFLNSRHARPRSASASRIARWQVSSPNFSRGPFEAVPSPRGQPNGVIVDCVEFQAFPYSTTWNISAFPLRRFKGQYSRP